MCVKSRQPNQILPFDHIFLELIILLCREKEVSLLSIIYNLNFEIEPMSQTGHKNLSYPKMATKF